MSAMPDPSTSADRPPTINIAALPPEEQIITAWEISNGLRNLSRYCRGFQIAMSLFDFSKAETVRFEADGIKPSLPFQEWMYLAGRDAAITIFHFGKAISIIRRTIFDNCPELAAKLDESEFQKVISFFKKRFPRWEGIRHTVAHAAEMALDPAEAPKHFISANIPVEGLPP